MQSQLAQLSAILCVAAVVAGSAAGSAAETDPTVEDAGVFKVTSARMPRTESFEVRRASDGTHLLRSTTVGAGDQYRVSGQWTYSADWSAAGARGEGQIDGKSLSIVIERSGDSALIRARHADGERVHRAACGTDCLIDLTPSALPMFTMTRRYDIARGGAQKFRWVGHSLTGDRVLLDGAARIERVHVADFRAADGRSVEVQQFLFIDTLPEETSGRWIDVLINLYVDKEHRPLAFAIGSSTRGERVGYEGLISALPFRAR